MIKKEFADYLAQHPNVERRIEKTAMAVTILIAGAGGVAFGFNIGGSERVREIAYPAIRAIGGLTEQFFK